MSRNIFNVANIFNIRGARHLAGNDLPTISGGKCEVIKVPSSFQG
jgi:hypothetical protein